MHVRALHLIGRAAAFASGTLASGIIALGACAREAARPVVRAPSAASAARGLAILRHTPDSLPEDAGSGLTCTNCHLNDGRQAGAMPWTGVTARFPQYRARTGKVDAIEDRINDCFRRSLNGKALATDDPAMRDIVAYMTELSRGAPPGGQVPGQGLAKLAARAADTARGAGVYAARCARCHGDDGAGMPPPIPPLWGARSFTIGAGMARLNTAAAFVRANMPLDEAGTLTDQQAFDVAAYVDSRPRPDFAGKEHDWPAGGAPPDVPYRIGVPRAVTPDEAPRQAPR